MPITTGTLTMCFRTALAKRGISVQRYWNATMVGPDVRKFLQWFAEILAEVRDAMAPLHGPTKANKFFSTIVLCWIISKKPAI